VEILHTMEHMLSLGMEVGRGAGASLPGVQLSFFQEFELSWEFHNCCVGPGSELGLGW